MSGMPTLTGIADLDVLRDLLPGLLPRFITPMLYQLILECSPEALLRRVVIAGALPTHGRGQAEPPQLRLIGWVQYWDPRSAWWIKPGRFAHTAFTKT